jgi:hypothetical protein
MNRLSHILAILIMIGFSTTSQAQDLPECDSELVAALTAELFRYDDVYHLVKNQGKDVNCLFVVHDHSVSPLLFAVSYNQARLSKLLLEQGADPNFIQPETNVTPLARVAWKAGGKDSTSKEWMDNFEMANHLIYYGADYEYKFLVDMSAEDGSLITIETNIRKMSRTFIEAVLDRQNNDWTGRTPKAKKTLALRIEKNKEKARRLRERTAKKIVF